MKRKNTLRILAIFCTVVMPLLVPYETQAQRKLVPVKCNAEEVEYGWVCLDSLFVEEGTLPPDTCGRLWEWSANEFRHRIKWRLLFTNFLILISFRGQDAYADEFKELSKSHGVIDSSNAYLIDEQVRAFLALLQDEVGFDQVVARAFSPKIGTDSPTFHCYVPRPQYYNYWKVKQLWALSRGADTTDSAAVEDSQVSNIKSLYLGGPCKVLTSVANDALSSAPSSPTAISYGTILLTGFKGRYSLYDISGRIVTQGELVHSDESSVLQVNPGVYVLQSGTNVRTIMVLP